MIKLATLSLASTLSACGSIPPLTATQVISLLGIGASLVACSSTGQPTITPATIIADANGLVATLQATVDAVIVANPNAIPPATVAALGQLQRDAAAALASLTGMATPPTTASALQVVLDYLNPALDAVGTALHADPVLNSKYGVAYAAAQALVIGVIEPYIAQVIVTSTPPPPNPAYAKQRAVLGIH